MKHILELNFKVLHYQKCIIECYKCLYIMKSKFETKQSR